MPLDSQRLGVHLHDHLNEAVEDELTQVGHLLPAHLLQFMPQHGNHILKHKFETFFRGKKNSLAALGAGELISWVEAHQKRCQERWGKTYYCTTHNTFAQWIHVCKMLPTSLSFLSKGVPPKILCHGIKDYVRKTLCRDVQHHEHVLVNSCVTSIRKVLPRNGASNLMIISRNYLFEKSVPGCPCCSSNP